MSVRRGLTGAFLALAFGMILLGQASAQGFGGRGPIMRPAPVDGWDRGQQDADKIRVNEEVRQFFSGTQIIHVKQLLNLAQYRGMTLKKVVLVGETRNGGGTAELLINGQSQGAPTRVGTTIENNPLLPRQQNLTIGRDINTLQIRLNGQFYVEKVIAVLDESIRPGPGPRPGAELVARKYISQSFRGFETLQLRQMMDLDRNFRGMKIARVIVRGESIYGQAQARLMINSRQVGQTQTFARFRTDLSFSLPNSSDTLGMEIQSLQLDLSGDIYVEEIEVHFERMGGGFPNPGPGPIPFPSDRLDRVVRLPLKGAHSLGLIDVVNASVQDGRREVSRVEISVFGANERAALALCVNTARGQVCDTEEDLSFGRQTRITLDVRGRTALKDLVLLSKGTLTLDRISVFFAN